MLQEKNILVNASAAKTGGAETIIRTFVQEASLSSDINFIILTPLKFENVPNHIQLIDYYTSGLNTIFFSTLGIIKFIKKYKPNKILSFSNINYILAPSKGITYFHQFKALEDGHSDIKIKIYRLLINFFLRKNIFILQSEYIKSIFQSKFKINPEQAISVWPGFLVPQPSKDMILLNTIKEGKDLYKGLMPIAYNASHKNISLIRNLENFLEEKSIRIHSLLPKEDLDINRIVHHGAIDRSELFALYAVVDFLIFPSKSETVGLPIFEFLETGKPTFVYAADYAIHFYKQFNEPENLILFKDEEDLKRLFLQKIDLITPKKNYSDGEWYKILESL
ncbi:hypothetical protein [uncultured Dokdonia sp.]|uniref:hypothetical protein n=1 Tax=uncultured Dokdonia sp. TaxID=575653 RepID=UPI002630D1F5|nr:hypothetical protein [uncultured Dokdonia sp.]